MAVITLTCMLERYDGKRKTTALVVGIALIFALAL